jgi:hypothetical protein
LEDDILGVAKFVSEGSEYMLGANSHAHTQAFHYPALVGFTFVNWLLVVYPDDSRTVLLPQDDLLSVAKMISEGFNILLGADSHASAHIYIQALYQP